ncbi:Nascent polypeptide-associated complex subunit beta [Coemansia sp. RSA 2167]|nr:Nascent polypeptide-associated complex subunit beta [Coemansia sp. RSA 1752]KAJ1757531.1 Nascent polypeptide-associated complex subunit beta [Coemansia sp. RSA 1824]KAJ1777355.1 Nascent polypeptide-associated complex subunit beta [Coemansia sp. RSA 2167]KAJ1779331.1 Nascent polypeptide-associated complex subunit beta [Coemansia sp. RSA 1938]KAJ2136254.1 Nascent polypeptide-associated complex subunit beta [Coemansia sp. RSA 788]KAJ2150478.1 Nascent polypeptide-associated complex subunit beta
MNPEKLAKLQAQARIGGKGTPRRKVVKSTKAVSKEDPKIASTLKQLGVQPIPDIETINMFMESGKVMAFKAPRLSANVEANTFVVAGKAEEKSPEQALTEMISRMGSFDQNTLSQLAKMTSGMQSSTDAGDVDDDIPDLISASEEQDKSTDLDAAD